MGLKQRQYKNKSFDLFNVKDIFIQFKYSCQFDSCIWNEKGFLRQNLSILDHLVGLINPLKSGLSFPPSYFFQTYLQRRYKRKKLLLELSLTSIYFTMFHKKNPGVVPALEVNNFANYFFLSVELLKQLSWWRHTLFDSNYLACNVMPEGISVFVSCLGLLNYYLGLKTVDVWYYALIQPQSI